MTIADFGTLQMTRTNPAHVGNAELSEIAGAPFNKIPSAAENGAAKAGASFGEYLADAINAMNSQQLDASALEQKLLTDPDSVELHDITIAMAKARMSLSLAQTVIDRIVSGWNEITTTR